MSDKMKEIVIGTAIEYKFRVNEIQINPGSLFIDLFKNPADFSTNLAIVETTLRNARANYKIFQTDVPLRAAKWSE